jgi:hypothetical protein
MAISSVMFRRHPVSAALDESCRLSDLYHVSVSEGMRVIVFACVPTIAAFLICFAIAMTR